MLIFLLNHINEELKHSNLRFRLQCFWKVAWWCQAMLSICCFFYIVAWWRDPMFFFFFLAPDPPAAVPRHTLRRHQPGDGERWGAGGPEDQPEPGQRQWGRVLGPQTHQRPLSSSIPKPPTLPGPKGGCAKAQYGVALNALRHNMHTQINLWTSIQKTVIGMYAYCFIKHFKWIFTWSSVFSMMYSVKYMFHGDNFYFTGGNMIF